MDFAWTGMDYAEYKLWTLQNNCIKWDLKQAAIIGPLGVHFTMVPLWTATSC